MTDLEKAMKQALDALEEIALAGMSGTGQESDEAITEWHARQAWKFIGIATRALEPVKKALADQPAEQQERCHLCDCAGDIHNPDGEWRGECPYCTSPQPAPVQQEPVAWMREGWGPDCGPYIEFYRDDEMGWRDRKEWTALYTSPPAQRTWVGLTEEELQKILQEVSGNGWKPLLEAIEAKLKEKNT